MNTAYRADIDGLRAIAVIAVVLFHAGTVVPGGFVGVDVFFVISGYLITGLIADDLDRGRFSLARFWERRIRRIWPASLAVTVATLSAGWLLMLPHDYRGLAVDALSHIFMAANIRYWITTNYFAPVAELRPLLHTWSLAIEEQFYVVIPLVMALSWRLGRAWCIGIFALLGAASLAAAALLLETRPGAVFFLLPFRAWELAVGSLVSLLPRPTALPRWWRETIGVAGIGMIALPCLVYNRHTSFPALAAVPPCLGTAMLIVAGQRDTTPLASRILASTPLRVVGLMSYSIYLWHWPVLSLLRYYVGVDLPAGWTALALAVVAACSALSWRYIEQPFRRAGPALMPRLVVPAALAISALVAAGCLWIRHAGGVPARFTPGVRRLIEPFCVDWQHVGWRVLRDRGHVTSAFPPIGEAGGSGRPCFLLWGDSHAMAISPAVDAAARSVGVAGVAALEEGVPPWPTGSGGFADDVVAWIRVEKPRHVILCARWSLYLGNVSHDEGATSASGPPDIATLRTPSFRFAEANLHTVLEACAASGSIVWILQDVPDQSPTTPPRRRILDVHLSGRPLELDGVTRSMHARHQLAARALFESLPSRDLTFVDLGAPFFGADARSHVGRDGALWYSDSTHLTPTGANEVLGEIFQEMFVRIAKDCRDAL